MIYLFSKLFTAFLLPPGIFITLLVAMAFFVKRYRKRLLFLSTLFYLLSSHPFADALLSYFESPYRHCQLPQNADIVITLGGGNIAGNPIPLIGEALKRHLYGIAIAKRMDIPVVISGRGENGYNEFQGLLDTIKTLRPLIHEPLTVSDRYMDQFVVIPETESADTYENVRNSLAIIGKKEPTIIVVTSAYHMRRALRIFHLAGVKKVFPAAVNFYVPSTPRSYNWQDSLPSMEALQNSYRAIHEFFGLCKVVPREQPKFPSVHLLRDLLSISFSTPFDYFTNTELLLSRTSSPMSRKKSRQSHFS